MNRPKLILIDLDGTLVDSVPDLAFSINQMMEAIGRPSYTESHVRNWVGNGVEKLAKRALMDDLDAEPSSEDFNQGYPFFMDSYDKHNGERSALYPGVREGIDKLKAEGYIIGCVTNKAAQFTIPLLKALASMMISASSSAATPCRRKNPTPCLCSTPPGNSTPPRKSQ